MEDMRTGLARLLNDHPTAVLFGPFLRESTVEPPIPAERI